MYRLIKTLTGEYYVSLSLNAIKVLHANQKHIWSPLFNLHKAS